MKLINLDNPGNTLLQKSKTEILDFAKSLKSKYDALTEFEMLYKLQLLIKTRMDCLKDDSMNVFIEKFGGSKTEKENGFTITLKDNNVYEYSTQVQELEETAKRISEQIKELKEIERQNGEAKILKQTNSLTFTLK